MDLERDEIFFARDFLQELRNREIKRFPFKTQKYYQALNSLREMFESQSEEGIPTPLETLLIKNTQGEFPRMNNAVQYCFGGNIGVIAPRFEIVEVKIPLSVDTRYPLAKQFAGRFIKELNLS